MSTAVLVYFKSLACGAASFLAGVFIDVDHILDYLIYRGPRFNIRDFYYSCIEIRFKKIYIIFHSYELIILLWAAIIILQLDNVWKAIAIGATQHLVLDDIRHFYFGRKSFLPYFFLFRLKNRFITEKIIKER